MVAGLRQVVGAEVPLGPSPQAPSQCLDPPLLCPREDEEGGGSEARAGFLCFMANFSA